MREGCQNRRNSGSGWTLNRPKSDLKSSKIQGDAKESEEEVKNTGEESAKEAKEEGKNTGEEGAQEAKEDVPNTGEERAHLTGEELQETEEEARLTRKAFFNVFALRLVSWCDTDAQTPMLGAQRDQRGCVTETD